MQTADAEQDRVPSPPQDDLALLCRVAAHDHQAFEEFYQRYTPRLTHYLRTLLGSSELIEDVVHDVWLVVWHQANKYQATGRVSTWLFGIARHKALKARARATRPHHAPPPTCTQADACDPAQRLARQEQARLVLQALDTLPPTQREVFVLTYSYNYPAQAIAAYQDCALATVRYRLQQARRRLATTLAAWGLAPHAPGAAALPARSGTTAAGHAAARCCDLAHTF